MWHEGVEYCADIEALHQAVHSPTGRDQKAWPSTNQKKSVQKKCVHLCGEFHINFRDPNGKEEGGCLGTHQLHNNSHQHREISN